MKRSYLRVLKLLLPLLSILVLFGILEVITKVGLAAGWLKYEPPMTTQLPRGTEDWRYAHITADDLRRPDPVLWWRPREGPPYNEQGFKGPAVQIPKPEDAIRILVYGDSNTEGTPEHSWPQRLQARLSERAHSGRTYEVLNAGVAGYSSHQGLLRYREDSATYQPDIVLVSFGWNDLATTAGPADHEFTPPPRILISLERFFLRFKFYLVARYYAQKSKQPHSTTLTSRVPLLEYVRNLEGFQHEAKSKHAAAVLLTRPHREPPEKLRELTPNWRARVPDYNAALLRLASDTNGYAIDVQKAFEDTPELFGDECHFTTEGQDAMARFLIQKLGELGLI